MKIYVAMKNADMTEGRGPMVPDSYFLNKKHAEKYIDTKTGVMGQKGPWSDKKYGDWEVKEVECFDYDVVQAQEQKEEAKQRALNKLTRYDKIILGLEEASNEN